MFTRPDLDDRVLVDALSAGWGFDAATLDYRPVGFGSHHWLAASAAGDRRFVTVDDLHAKLRSRSDTTDATFERLAAAFRAARALADVGLAFVVAPLPDAAGRVLARVGERWSMVAHPFLDGPPCGPQGDYTSDDDRRTVLGMVVEMHAATGRLGALPPADDLAVPLREELLAAIDGPWSSGPYSAPARSLLAAHASGVRRRLGHYDDLAARVAARPERWVVTHGEPHAGNVLATPAGLRIVDWEATLLAPPERDLWDLATGHPWVLDGYPGEIDTDALDLYRLWYELAEIAGYVALFRAPHGETADTAESWQNLGYFLRR